MELEEQRRKRYERYARRVEYKRGENETRGEE
jgi:hypothetical protein